MQQEKVLIFRLSSLGDLVLASSVLNTPLARSGVDWVVSEQWAPLLEGHPQIKRLWRFNKQTGLRGWVSLCRMIFDQDYTEVWDLHSNLRTILARILFLFWGLKRLRSVRWKKISKQRFCFYGFVLFKALWPKFLRPTPWVERFVKLAGGSGDEKPDFRYLMQQLPEGFQAQPPYVCVMPSSQWPGKKWPIERFTQLIKKGSFFPVVLGTLQDQASDELVADLKKNKIPYFSAVGEFSLPETAAVLAKAQAYLGVDTGLGHLAEAMGTRAWVVFGPTHPDSGFAPWRKESRSLGMNLWCRPCGKDGRMCFRPLRRQYCLKGLEADQAWEQIQK